MKFRNFEFLRPEWQELAELGGFAEAYAYAVRWFRARDFNLPNPGYYPAA